MEPALLGLIGIFVVWQVVAFFLQSRKKTADSATQPV
jgi:hypothetical protein